MSSLDLSREEKHEQIDGAALLLKSDKWSHMMRLWGPYRSRVCPGTERDMLLYDKGVRADKHVCVKCFKDELNSDIKVGFERERGERRRGREMGLQKWMLTSVVLQGCLHFFTHTGKCCGNGLLGIQIGPAQNPPVEVRRYYQLNALKVSKVKARMINGPCDRYAVINHITRWEYKCINTPVTL